VAYGTYLIVAKKATLQKIADAIAERTDDGASGDPLVAVSATRALLSAARAELLAATDPGVTVAEQLVGMGAQRVETLSAPQVTALLASRERSELGLRRSVGEDQLVVDGQDWHIARTRLHEAWELVNGPEQIDWQGIVAGQIDTGYTEHPCLGWAGGASTVVIADDGRNFFYAEMYGESDDHAWGNRDPLSAIDPFTGPDGGHGTRTGSVLAGFDESAAARVNPDGGPLLDGYYGAAPKLPYIPIRLCNSVTIDQVAEALGDALEYLVAGDRCQVITLSMGAAPLGLPRKTRDMIDLAYAKGIIVCCAAGNVVPFVATPASAPRTIAVGGVAPNDEPWSDSSFGGEVNICAPAWPVRRATTTLRGKFEYGHGGGTSYATPQVAGTAALWLAKHRAVLDARYPEPWMRVAAFKKILLERADPPAGWDSARYGKGILDARAVLDEPLPPRGTLVRDDQPH
jgi:subtilisin family serine protease